MFNDKKLIELERWIKSLNGRLSSQKYETEVLISQLQEEIKNLNFVFGKHNMTLHGPSGVVEQINNLYSEVEELKKRNKSKDDEHSIGENKMKTKRFLKDIESSLYDHEQRLINLAERIEKFEPTITYSNPTITWDSDREFPNPLPNPLPCPICNEGAETTIKPLSSDNDQYTLYCRHHDMMKASGFTEREAIKKWNGKVSMMYQTGNRRTE